VSGAAFSIRKPTRPLQQPPKAGDRPDLGCRSLCHRNLFGYLGLAGCRALVSPYCGYAPSVGMRWRSGARTRRLEQRSGRDSGPPSAHMDWGEERILGSRRSTRRKSGRVYGPPPKAGDAFESGGAEIASSGPRGKCSPVGRSPGDDQPFAPIKTATSRARRKSTSWLP
jgi:hypothetical protein